MDPNRHKYNLQIIPREQSVVFDFGTYTAGNTVGHYRMCQDKYRAILRQHNINWDDIVFVDFKMLDMYGDYLTWAFQDLQRILDNAQPIKILHVACNNYTPRYNTMIQDAQVFKDITWRGSLIMEYYYHNYPGEIAPIVEQLTPLVPPGVLQADFYIDGMNLHIPLL
jgi:hypothetical protein